MKNLDKIKNIWENLEDNFKKSEKTERLDYIKYIMGYNGKNTAVSYIIDKMKSETEYYTAEELNDYVKYSKALENLEKLILENKLNEIAQFEGLIDECLNIKMEREVREVPADLFESLSVHYLEVYEPKVYNTTLSDIFNKTGNFGKVTKLVNEEIISVNLKDEHAVVVSDSEVLDMIGEHYKVKEFNTKIIDACIVLSDNEKLEFNTLFVDSEYYKVDNKILTLSVGEFTEEYKIRKTNTFTGKTGDFYRIQITTATGKKTVICV